MTAGWLPPSWTDVFPPPPPGHDPLTAELAGVALECARAASAVLEDDRPHGGGPGGGWGVTEAVAEAVAESVGTKTSPTDMVSDADRGAEAAVAAVLAERRPSDAVVGEEGTERAGTTGVRWVVDPLDGTTNFLFGIPQYSVSVAAQAASGATLVGVVADPSHREVWAAARGWGARRNGAVCRVAVGRSTLATALVGTGFGYRPERRAWQGAVAAQVLPRVRDLRRLGSAALDLCWTAGGRLDAYYEWGLNAWDLAAGALICQEAGGRVESKPGHLIVAATPELFEPLCALLESAGGFDAEEGPEPRDW